MSPESMKIVRAAVNDAGDRLRGRLPPHPDHPERNSYAHVWRAIKERFGSSYKDLDDSAVPQVLALVQELQENP